MIKKTHNWSVEELYILHLQCPYCRQELQITSHSDISFEEGESFNCKCCNRDFKLGKPE